jgi:hypothetical protein
MNTQRFWISCIILIALVVFIHFFSASSVDVETTYSTGIYPGFASALRLFSGWIPFSIGDLLYGLFGLWLLWKLVKVVMAIIHKKVSKIACTRGFQKSILLVLTLYVLFNLFWGINYNRQGITKQLYLKTDTIGFADIKDLSFLLVEKLNLTKKYLVNKNISYPSNSGIFKRVEAAYAKAKDSLPFLNYQNISIKPSLWGWLGNYMGFTGYYNPFTGEAHVNTTAPKFLLPFIACHEVAHQVGYARENEANSVGYLAALYSSDSLLLYSAYFDLYNYASREFALQSFLRKDTSGLHLLKTQLSPEVKADFKEMFAYFQKHRNPVEPFIRKGYSFYLRNNNQPGGIRSYDEVLGFMVAFYKKYGRL